MKKKILSTLVFLIGVLGVMYFMGVFSSGEATEEDHAQAESTNSAVNDSQSQENLDATTPDFEDSTELDTGLEFDENDPASML